MTRGDASARLAILLVRNRFGCAPRRRGAFPRPSGVGGPRRRGHRERGGLRIRVWKTKQGHRVGLRDAGRRLLAGPRDRAMDRTQTGQRHGCCWGIATRGEGLPVGADPGRGPEEDRPNTGGEFDPGSGSTLAACLMHASRTGSSSDGLRGGRVRTTWAICRRVGDSFRKREVIPHELRCRVGW